MRVKINKRSPSSPSLSIEDALDKALTIYHQEKLNPMHPDIAAQDIGYSNAINGSAGAVLATLKVFGLLLVPEKGQLLISGDVQEFKLNPDESIKQQLLNKWLNTPKVYKAIFEKYGPNLPSDANLCHFLISELNFRDEGSALHCINKLKTSIIYVENRSGSLHSAPLEQAANSPKEALVHKADKEQVSTQTEASRGYDRFPVRLSNRRKAWIEIPDTFLESDKALIKAQLDLIITDDGSYQ